MYTVQYKCTLYSTAMSSFVWAAMVRSDHWVRRTLGNPGVRANKNDEPGPDLPSARLVIENAKRKKCPADTINEFEL